MNQAEEDNIDNNPNFFEEHKKTKHFKIVENFKKGYHRRHKSTGRDRSSKNSAEKDHGAKGHKRSVSGVEIDFSKYLNFEQLQKKNQNDNDLVSSPIISSLDQKEKTNQIKFTTFQKIRENIQ